MEEILTAVKHKEHDNVQQWSELICISDRAERYAWQIYFPAKSGSAQWPATSKPMTSSVLFSF
jgi:hypothetical protein